MKKGAANAIDKQVNPLYITDRHSGSKAETDVPGDEARPLLAGHHLPAETADNYRSSLMASTSTSCR